MSAPVPVVVLLDGRLVASASSARLIGGVVHGPFAPFAAALAQRISIDPASGAVTFERAGKRVTMTMPPGELGNILFPLAATARALGDSVRYDASSRTLSIWQPAPGPVATMTPFAAAAVPPVPLATLRPTLLPTPRPTPSGIPQPRRTPIVLLGPT
jgi:hypothetical protein